MFEFMMSVAIGFSGSFFVTCLLLGFIMAKTGYVPSLVLAKRTREREGGRNGILLR
jgi:hypothetical protein